RGINRRSRTAAAAQDQPQREDAEARRGPGVRAGPTAAGAEAGVGAGAGGQLVLAGRRAAVAAGGVAMVAGLAGLDEAVAAGRLPGDQAALVEVPAPRLEAPVADQAEPELDLAVHHLPGNIDILELPLSVDMIVSGMRGI